MVLYSYFHSPTEEWEAIVITTYHGLLEYPIKRVRYPDPDPNAFQTIFIKYDRIS